MNKKAFKKYLQGDGSPLYFKDENNYYKLVGQRCSYYICVMQNGRCRLGPWMNGGDWNSFRDECVLLNKKEALMGKLVDQYNKLAPIINKAKIK